MNSQTIWQAITWIMIALTTLSAFINLVDVGKPRKPLTGGATVVIVIYVTILVIVLLHWMGEACVG